MNISINIPSYKRPDKVLTLAYIPFAKVWVDEGEAEAYKQNYPDANIVACPKGIQGFGVPRVRNYILDKEFENGADVVLIVDDDLKCFERFEAVGLFGYKKVKIETEEILPFLEKYSIMARDMGAYFWGLNCNPDSLSYRHYSPFSTVSYIGGPFQCFLRGGELRYDENIPLKEDYDMTLQQLNRYRVVLRLNMYHYICLQAVNKGGCASLRNRQREKEENLKLLRKWGSNIVRFDKSNKGHTTKEKLDDFNPIIKIPIKGI